MVLQSENYVLIEGEERSLKCFAKVVVMFSQLFISATNCGINM